MFKTEPETDAQIEHRLSCQRLLMEHMSQVPDRYSIWATDDPDKRIIRYTPEDPLTGGMDYTFIGERMVSSVKT